MKKNLTILAIAVIAISFVSCNRDNNNEDTKPIPLTVTAVVENWDEHNDLIISNVVATSLTNNYAVESIASGDFYNGSFTITLPAILNDKFLISNPFRGLEARGFTISDKNVRTTHFFDGMVVFAINDDNQIIGFFAHRNLSDFDSHLEAFFMYADRDATITGTYRGITQGGQNHNETWLVFLRRGWNKVYFRGWESEIQEVCTMFTMFVTEPIFGELNWYFWELWGDYYDPAGVDSTSLRASPL